MADDYTPSVRTVRGAYFQAMGHTGALVSAKKLDGEFTRFIDSLAAVRRVAPDRETLARAIFEANPENVTIAFEDAAGSSFKTIRRWAEDARTMAGALLASGVLVPADQVRAEALDEAEEIIRGVLHRLVNAHVDIIAAELNKRAAEYRKAAGA